MAPSELTATCPACGYPIDGAACERCGGRVCRGPGQREIEPRAGFVLTDLAHGFMSLFIGALELFHRREYVGKLALPILANIVVLTLVMIGFTWGLWEFFEWLIGDWEGTEWLRSAASWLTGALSLVLAAVTLFMLAPVIIETVTGPFLDPIADATEKWHGGSEMKAVDIGMWKGIVVGVRGSAQILAVQLMILIPCLLLSLFGIGAILAIVISAWFNALIWFDIPCGRRGYGLRDRVALIRRNWARSIGFGLAFQVGMLIPIFNFLLLTPAAAVATSRLYFHFAKDRPAGNVRAPEPAPETCRSD